MSYLALTASPYNETETFTTINDTNDKNDKIGEKRQTRNSNNSKTIKKRQPINPKLGTILETIHNKGSDMPEDNVSGENVGGTMGDFNPPTYPQSTVPLNKTFTENTDFYAPPPWQESPMSMNTNMNMNMNTTNTNTNKNKNKNDSPVGVEGFNNLPNTYSNDFYKQYVPYYNQMSQGTGNKDQLLEKLNYMIHLLEEQKEEKTGHIMEELILYSFLGIFMIFIVDSFARAGKYVR